MIAVGMALACMGVIFVAATMLLTFWWATLWVWWMLAVDPERGAASESLLRVFRLSGALPIVLLQVGLGVLVPLAGWRLLSPNIQNLAETVRYIDALRLVAESKLDMLLLTALVIVGSLNRWWPEKIGHPELDRMQRWADRETGGDQSV